VLKAPEIKEPLTKITDSYKKKVEASVLPPDPLRIVEAVMRIPPSIEHMLPLPPIIETVHSEVIFPFIESLPRLPLTSEPPVFKWGEWIKE
jgi:hypothetical protein